MSTLTKEERDTMLKAVEVAACALEGLPPAHRLLATAHVVGLTLVATTPKDMHADTLQRLFEGPIKGAVRSYTNAADLLDGMNGPRQ